MGPSNGIHINQGEFAVGSDPDFVISTLLGSCVAVCLWDGKAGLGGMNHILLPRETGGAASGASFGVNAMELLINAIIKIGGDRNALTAKVFGGARMVQGLSDIGNSNQQFVAEFLAAERIPCLSESTGGDLGRRVKFWPHSGKVRQRFMEAVVQEVPPPKPKPTDIELF